jgi:nitric-oxide synthase
MDAISPESPAANHAGCPAAAGGGEMDHDGLVAMARLAWRNADRCIGRLLWQSLEVRDARHLGRAEEIFNACVEHLDYSTNGGRIRSLVTVFAPAAGDGTGIRIWNRQLIRYAGYRAADDTTLGDPEQEAFTRMAMHLGWQPPREKSAFDLLPLIIQVPGGGPEVFVLPTASVLEVPISHPDLAWFASLGLKWHALPAVADMALVGHNQRFTAAPFSGFYMGTEIAARNFADAQRYNLLPLIAERMGLNRSSRHLLWKDRALIELNTAVLHSFREAGVAIIDHHTASAQFIQHVSNEESCGRSVPGDWSWLVPPLSGSTCPVFHRYYDDVRPEPAFVSQPPAWRGAER